MCTLDKYSNAFACVHQRECNDMLEIGNSENNEHFISDIENYEIPDNSLKMGNSQFRENLANCERLDLCEDPSIILSDIRRKNLNRPIIGHININFLESKFEALKLLIENILDVLVVTETKIDESYPTSPIRNQWIRNPLQDRS